jgi:hemerythrin superfamily protein
LRPFPVTAAKMSTVSDLIIHDHEELKDCYSKIKKSSDSDTKNRWRNQFVWELARHSIAEELVVYPAMEKYITPGGKQMADKDREEHQTVHALKTFGSFVSVANRR